MREGILKGHTISLVTASIIFLSSIGPVHANFMGMDDFDDNSVDTSKWGTDFTAGGVLLTEINSQLEYTSTASGGIVEHPWILNQGSYTQDWSVQLDVGIGNISLPAGQFDFTSINLLIANNGDLSDFAVMGLEVDNFGTGRHFGSSVVTDGISPGSTLADTTSYNASVQIAFDSMNTLLIFQYDEDGPVGGYNWTMLSQENIGSLWGMTDLSVFDVFVAAGSQGIAVESGMVTADNFLASSVPEPTSLILLGTGLGVLGLAAYRRRKK